MFNTNIWSEILFYVTPNDIDNVALTNKAHHELIGKSPDLWQFLIRKSYPRYISPKYDLEAKILRHHYRILNDIDDFYRINNNNDKSYLARIIATKIRLENDGVKRYILINNTEVKFKIAKAENKKSYIITHIYNKLYKNKLLFNLLIHKCALEPQNYPFTLFVYYIDILHHGVFDIHSSWNHDLNTQWDIIISCMRYNFMSGLYHCQNYIHYLIHDNSKNAKTCLEYMREVYSTISIYFPEQMQFFAQFKVFTFDDERRIQGEIRYRINQDQIDVIIILIKNLSEPLVSTEVGFTKWNRYPKFIINSLFLIENESSYIAIQKIAKKYKNLLPDDDVVFDHTPFMSIPKISSSKLKLLHHKNGHVFGYRK